MKEIIKMKKIVALLLAMACMLSLVACGCEHVWEPATCTEPETCLECGETQGETVAHDWLDATYTAPKTCSVCGLTDGEPLEDPNEGFAESEVYTAVTSSITSSMTNYSPEVEYDRDAGIYYIYMTSPEGIAAALAAAPTQLYDSWQKVVDNLAKLTGTVSEAFTAAGYNVSCAIMLRSDVNPDKVILTAIDGDIVYNLMDELL